MAAKLPSESIQNLPASLSHQSSISNCSPPTTMPRAGSMAVSLRTTSWCARGCESVCFMMLDLLNEWRHFDAERGLVVEEVLPRTRDDDRAARVREALEAGRRLDLALDHTIEALGHENVRVLERLRQLVVGGC